MLCYSVVSARRASTTSPSSGPNSAAVYNHRIWLMLACAGIHTKVCTQSTSGVHVNNIRWTACMLLGSSSENFCTVIMEPCKWRTSGQDETTFRWCGHVLVEPCRTQARVSCMHANSLVHQILLFYTALSMFVHILLSFLLSGTTFRWCGSCWVFWVQLRVCFLFILLLVLFYIEAYNTVSL
jgi:hypothetical protein